MAGDARRDIFAESGLDWLKKMQPRFPVSATNISVLYEPREFFNELKVLAENSVRRITLASLYIGNGTLEDELIASIQNGMAKSPAARLTVLLDATRGSRGVVNSRTLLLPLLKEFPERCQVTLYHSPMLRGWIRWLLPERWNETVGLSHLKVYIFDNTLIMSGANLSDQYFVNRQDRYVIFRDCQELADHFENLVTSVASFSFQLMPNNSLELHPNWNIHPFLGKKEAFISKANQKIGKLLDVDVNPSLEESAKADTWVYPLIQMYPFGIRQDEMITTRLLTQSPSQSVTKLASGYFNLTKTYIDVILHSCKSTVDILTASPKANGFYGAKGFSGAIPNAYTYIEKCFYHDVHKLQQDDRIGMHEYERNGWTFHSKGVWYYPSPLSSGPVLTLVGSPNFGYRSVYRDLEAQVAIVTTNTELQQKFHTEQLRVYQSSTRVEAKTFTRPERKISLWVKIVTNIIKTFF